MREGFYGMGNFENVYFAQSLLWNKRAESSVFCGIKIAVLASCTAGLVNIPA